MFELRIHVFCTGANNVANGGQTDATWFNIQGNNRNIAECCVKILTQFKVDATSMQHVVCNNSQQGGQTDAIRRAQQYCMKLLEMHVASVWTRPIKCEDSMLSPYQPIKQMRLQYNIINVPFQEHHRFFPSVFLPVQKFWPKIWKKTKPVAET